MAQTKTIRFENDLHGTRTFARAKADGPGWTISARVMARVARDLCGMDDCTCGTLRGDQADPLAAEAWEAYQQWQTTEPGYGILGICGRVVVRK